MSSTNTSNPSEIAQKPSEIAEQFPKTQFPKTQFPKNKKQTIIRYNQKSNLDFKPAYFNTRIEVINMDTLVAAEKYKNEKVAVLNMANDFIPGGGYTSGSKEQESQLCLRTTLYTTLLQTPYPLNDDEMLYSPDIKVTKDANLQNIAEFDINVISAAAICQPGAIYTKEQKIMMAYKINKILKIAAYHCNDVIVLGAFGCGVYGNPPQEVADLFKSLIKSNYPSQFKVICFAILDRHNTGNFKVFHETFCGSAKVDP